MFDEIAISTGDAPGASSAAASGLLDWPWTLFSLETVGSTLVIIPTISGGMFRYAQLQTEANALRRKLDQSAIAGLIIDLQALDYIGSEVIGAIVALARKAEDMGGRAVFCSAAPQLTEIFTNMRLDRLWPLFATRAEALEAVQRRVA